MMYLIVFTACNRIIPEVYTVTKSWKSALKLIEKFGGKPERADIMDEDELEINEESYHEVVYAPLFKFSEQNSMACHDCKDKTLMHIIQFDGKTTIQELVNDDVDMYVV